MPSMFYRGKIHNGRGEGIERRGWNTTVGTFSGGPVAKTPSFHGKGRGFQPCLGNKIPQAEQQGQDNKTKC